MVGEACTNAIEHGNEFLGQFQVKISNGNGAITVRVVDNGSSPIPIFASTPALKINEHNRGMGLYLIDQLADKVEAAHQVGRNEISMTSYV